MRELRFSRLVGSRVVDTDGRALGRVFDVHVEERDGRLHVAHLLVGRAGLLARLSLDAGWRRRGEDVAWERVVDPGEPIVVRPLPP